MTLHKISIRTKKKSDFYEITSEVQDVVSASGIKNGICYIFVPHTTAAVTVNEHADPDVVQDIITCLETQIPSGLDYRHVEGNSPGHIKASLIGSSQVVFVEDGKLALGTWQGIFFCEFDGPRDRIVLVKVLNEK
jgi:secondary thiamine-phosphate synthase enzyme